MLRLLASAAIFAAALLPAACTTTGLSTASAEAPVAAELSAAPASGFHPNSIQPETTLDVTATGQSRAAPDIAIVSVGVTANAKTASEAMASQAASMNAMFETLSAAGVEARDMQTSGLTLYPEYDYVTINEDNGVQRQENRLRGYAASNQLTLRARDLNGVGALLDRLVSVGGNTINGISYGLDDPSPAEDAARRAAMEAALKRAELYAAASGHRVGRIVTISEQQTYFETVTVTGARLQSGGAEPPPPPTPTAAGQVGYTANVTVKFELVK
jgi:uncharacterized protein